MSHSEIKKITVPSSAENNEELGHHVDEVADKVSSQLEAIEKFIARRFDELSMEINATSQQIDMNEEGSARKFSEIFEVLKAVSYSGDGSTAANTGVELDAVVATTERAATQILDNAERLSGLVEKGRGAASADEQSAIWNEMEAAIGEIITACSFQDITGQRIRRTLDNLHDVEERLGNALGQMGIDVAAQATAHTDIASAQSTQGDIDAMFGEGGTPADKKDDSNGGESKSGVTQADIDAMFGE